MVDKLYKEGAEDISVVENFAEFENMNDIDDIDPCRVMVEVDTENNCMYMMRLNGLDTIR